VQFAVSWMVGEKVGAIPGADTGDGRDDTRAGRIE